ncbi:MAG: hypothetical protein KIT87_24430 [Anaerolineae bacterium]|nr:hypothetical protein [Anaerolineae bacterium]
MFPSTDPYLPDLAASMGRPAKLRRLVASLLLVFALIAGLVVNHAPTASADSPTADTTSGASPTGACYQLYPASPSNVRATLLSPYSIRLTWTDNSCNEDVFRLYDNGLYVGTVNANVTYATFNVQRYSTHCYSVVAVRGMWYTSSPAYASCVQAR